MSGKKEEIDFWKQKLLEDLNKLTRALEIYLSDYISNFMLGNGLPDIKTCHIWTKFYRSTIHVHIRGYTENIRFWSLIMCMEKLI